MTTMMKFPLCGDSLLIIFMGGSLMAVFGIAMVRINRKAQHQVSNLVYALEILTILPILCWRVYESCRELEEMHEKVLLVQAAITTQEPSTSPPTSQQDTRWWDFLSKYFRENPIAAECYVPPFPDAFRELIDSYEYEGEKVDMSSPRQCSYSKKTDVRGNPKETVILGEEVARIQNANGSSHTPILVELRGITLRQLHATNANIIARCEKEGWVSTFDGKSLNPDTVTLYDVNEYIVLPFTKDSQVSFVETLPSTAGTQPPRFFVSHWWGEPFVRTLACLEQFVKDFSKNSYDSDDARGGGMTIDTPIWICIFANNQWHINEELGQDSNPMKSPFGKAMGESKGTISILDAKGIVFTRAWCTLELFMTFNAKKNDEDDADVKNRGVWGVYTAHEHTYKQYRSEYNNDYSEERAAVGIVSGGAPYENSSYDTSLRERYFPMELIQMSRGIDIKSAEASKEDDRKRILNAIAGIDNLEADPHTDHVNYTKLNDAVKGAFAASMPVLNAAAAAGGDEWTDTLDRFSKGVMTDTLVLDFRSFHPCLSSSQARELMSHVPSTCDSLNIGFAEGEGEGAIEGMIEWIGKAKTIKTLTCWDCKVGNAEGGKDAGIRLAAALEASNHVASIEFLRISHTDLIVSGNVSEWASALKKMTALKRLNLYGLGDYISDEEKSILRNATHALDVHFDL